MANDDRYELGRWVHENQSGFMIEGRPVTNIEMEAATYYAKMRKEDEQQAQLARVAARWRTINRRLTRWVAN